MLAVWQLTEVLNKHRETSDRAKAAGKLLGYSALAFTGYIFAVGERTNSRKQTRDFTRTLMEMPGGQLLVGAVGLVVLGIAAYHVHKGWKETFLQDLVEHPGKWAVVAGRVGYIVKGVALGVVGVLFVIAAVQHRSKEATGLDGALRTLQDAPFGAVLLTAVGRGDRGVRRVLVRAGALRTGLTAVPVAGFCRAQVVPRQQRTHRAVDQARRDIGGSVHAAIDPPVATRNGMSANRTINAVRRYLLEMRVAPTTQ